MVRRIEVELCHIDANRAVVKAISYSGDIALGSALGEGQTSIQAEEQALSRLMDRINGKENMGINFNTTNTKQDSKGKNRNDNDKTFSKINNSMNDPIESTVNISNKKENISVNNNKTNYEQQPEDWSEELAIVDYEIARIGWDRNKENTYIKRLFNYNNRHGITDFDELKLLIEQLKILNQGSDPSKELLPDIRKRLLSNGDKVLKELGWSKESARDFLFQQMSYSSRTEMNNTELKHFNTLLHKRLGMK